MGGALLALGSGTGGLGILAVAAHQRSWPPPLGGALIAAAVHAVGSAAVELRWLLLGPVDLWLYARPEPLVSVTVSLLAAGVVSEIAREERAPVALDAVAACLLALFAVLAMMSQPGSLLPSGAAFVLTLGASAAWILDAARRRMLSLRPSQLFGLVAMGIWGGGLVSGALLVARGLDEPFHDTFAELAPSHLLGPLLAGVALVAGVLDRQRGWSVLPWLGVGFCALVAGLGAYLTAAGLAALGLQGMPRRYHGYEPDGGGEGGWVVLGAGLALFALGLSAAAVASAVLGLVRAAREPEHQGLHPGPRRG